MKNLFITKLALLQLFIVSNYLLYLFNINNLILLLNLLIIFIFFFNNLFSNFFKELTILKIIIILLAIICLGSSAITVDARNIWLFQAKRIFFDQNIYATLDNYLGSFQNDYPTIVSSLSSSLAVLIGGWNEIFPKFSSIIFILAPLLFLANLLKDKSKEIIFCILILLIFGKKLIIGEMDALLSIYFLTICINFSYILFTGKKNRSENLDSKSMYIFSLANLIILSLLKTEAFGAIMIMIISSLFIKIILVQNSQNLLKFSLLNLIGLIPLSYWKYKIYISNIITSNDTWFEFLLFQERLLDFKLYIKVLNLIFHNTHSIITIILLTLLISKIKWTKVTRLEFFKLIKNNFIIQQFTLIFLSSAIYFMVIFFGLLISNFLYESFDELGSNVFRYNLPICFALCYGSILLIDQKKNIKLLQ